MRPASEVHSALELMRSEMDRIAPTLAQMASSGEKIENLAQLELVEHWMSLRVASDCLLWVTGESALQFGSPCEWLAAYLLDDPEKTGPSPETN